MPEPAPATFYQAALQIPAVDKWRLLWDADVLVKDLRAELARLRGALRRSAEALHGLSEDPEHLRSVFSECTNFRCVEAREALGA